MLFVVDEAVASGLDPGDVAVIEDVESVAEEVEREAFAETELLLESEAEVGKSRIAESVAADAGDEIQAAGAVQGGSEARDGDGG